MHIISITYIIFLKKYVNKLKSKMHHKPLKLFKNGHLDSQTLTMTIPKLFPGDSLRNLEWLSTSIIYLYFINEVQTTTSPLSREHRRLRNVKLASVLCLPRPRPPMRCQASKCAPSATTSPSYPASSHQVIAFPRLCPHLLVVTRNDDMPVTCGGSIPSDGDLVDII